jgi:hypothetical protein
LPVFRFTPPLICPALLMFDVPPCTTMPMLPEIVEPAVFVTFAFPMIASPRSLVETMELPPLFKTVPPAKKTAA